MRTRSPPANVACAAAIAAVFSNCSEALDTSNAAGDCVTVNREFLAVCDAPEITQALKITNLLSSSIHNDCHIAGQCLGNTVIQCDAYLKRTRTRRNTTWSTRCSPRHFHSLARSSTILISLPHPLLLTFVAVAGFMDAGICAGGNPGPCWIVPDGDSTSIIFVNFMPMHPAGFECSICKNNHRPRERGIEWGARAAHLDHFLQLLDHRFHLRFAQAILIQLQMTGYRVNCKCAMQFMNVP
jgi:hypothetical protein